MKNINTTLVSLIRLTRPRQWVKNVFVFAPLVFSGLFLSPGAIEKAAIAFLYFCLAASASYVLNDIRDLESDRMHPSKSKTRPIAAGMVSVSQAWMLMSLLYLGALSCWLYDPVLAGVLTAYILLNIAYSLYLKHQPVVDIFSIALGFVLRVGAGTAVLSLSLSFWMVITTLSLALYLAATKRKKEIASSGSQSRAVLASYSEQLVGRYAEMSATCALLFYGMFVLSDRPELAITIPFVMYGMFRYWFVTEAKGYGESPTDALFADFQLQACIVIWVGLCMYAIA